MKIKKLFDAYKQLINETLGAETAFTESGMINEYEKLDYGFFPLGSGVLTDRSKIDEAEIDECKIMVLGNDFGTISYTDNLISNGKRENNSKTIQNLKNKLGVEPETTFFTNFYMGIRDEKNHPGTTMTKLMVKRGKNYKDFCHQFFVTQLNLINPKIVLCLGIEVGKALISIFPEFSKNKLTSLYAGEVTKNYSVMIDDNVLGNRKFILIPHPSMANSNWGKNNIHSKIQKAILL